MKYRMYIDEVGNSDLGASENPNHRFLNLTGVVLEFEYVRNVVSPKLEALKAKYFQSHPDDPIILHRKEILNARKPFHALRDRQIRDSFDSELLKLLKDLDYVVLSIVIDKLEHKQRYHQWQYDPYHYCLAILIERYVMWLSGKDTRGDVMAESRGGKEDRRLKKSFRRLYDEGTSYVGKETFRERLTSCELKVKPKANNISGLQLADLIAHPIYKAMLHKHASIPVRNTFGNRIYKIIEDEKFNRSPDGKTDGWGTKWLP